ncbi:MAG: WD40/YVTN/BNR-like repeat-containing protein, partial [Blastocatellia bacterium]
VDGGNTWTKLVSPQSGSQVNYNIAIAVDPTDANTVYYATGTNAINNGGTLFRSTNGGQNWSDLSIGDGTEGLHADTHAIAVSPANGNILFTGNDGGIWRTNNATANIVTWKNLNPNLNITQFQSIAIHPTNPNFVIGGTQDNGTNLFTGQLSWRAIRGGDGGFTLIDQSNPQVLYHTFFNQNNSGGQRSQIGPEVSLNGGSTWSRRGCFNCAANQPGNFNASDRVGFYAPMAQNTGFTGQSGNVIYFGTHRLYRSPDQGLIWTGLGASTDGFGADLTKGTGRLSAIAAHPNLSNGQEIVWVGANDGSVQVTGNAGSGASATFTNLTKAPLPTRFVTDIALDASNIQRAVVTFSGFNSVTPTTPGHVFLTINQGQSWADISGNLPDVPVTSAAINPTNSSTIYIGTDLGVFQTTNGGTSWERLGNGMPRVATYMVRYQATTNTLFAATHGRGVYRLTTSRALATVSAASFS